VLKHSNKREYLNAATPQDVNIESAKSTLSPIYFSLVPSDFNQPWFHKQATRTIVEEQLKFCDLGTFIVRPSTSYGGCYALSWVNEEGKVEHQVVYNQFPGYSLKQKPQSEKEIYRSLSELVEQTHYLKTYLPNVVDPVQIQKSMDQSSTEIVNSMRTKLISNDKYFTQLDWTINLVEFSIRDFSQKFDHYESKTCIRFSNEEYVAPCIFKLDSYVAQFLTDALSKNETVRSLKITGYPGYMRRNFTPNITDSEVEFILSALEKNTTITAIDFSHNHITNHGAKLIANLILHNHSLKKIILDNNFISQEGLIAIAQSLRHNPNIERLSLFNQLQTQLNNSIVLSTSPYDRFLLRLMDDTLKRRSELLTSSLPTYQGFLTQIEAEQRLLSLPITSTEDYHLFYLHPNAPNRVYLCYTSAHHHPIIHQPIYRTLYGYSFNRILETDRVEDKGGVKAVPVPSLLDHCLWLIYAKGMSKEENSLPPELKEKINSVKDLVTLWRLENVPCPKVFKEKPIRQVGASTLTHLLSRNKNLLKTTLNLINPNNP